MAEILQIERLRLREMSPDDLDFLAEMLGDAEVTRYYAKQYSRAEAEEWLRRQIRRYEQDGFGFWLTLERESATPVGQVGLAMMDIGGAREPALGYLLHRPFWGRGYATEAAAACLVYGFETLLLPRIICPIRPENEPSLRVAARLGLKPEKNATYAGFEHRIFVATPETELPSERRVD